MLIDWVYCLPSSRRESGARINPLTWCKPSRGRPHGGRSIFLCCRSPARPSGASFVLNQPAAGGKLLPSGLWHHDRMLHVARPAPLRVAPPIQQHTLANLGKDACRTGRRRRDQIVALVQRLIIVLIDVLQLGWRHEPKLSFVGPRLEREQTFRGV